MDEIMSPAEEAQRRIDEFKAAVIIRLRDRCGIAIHDGEKAADAIFDFLREGPLIPEVQWQPDWEPA